MRVRLVVCLGGVIALFACESGGSSKDGSIAHDGGGPLTPDTRDAEGERPDPVRDATVEEPIDLVPIAQADFCAALTGPHDTWQDWLGRCCMQPQVLDQPLRLPIELLRGEVTLERCTATLAAFTDIGGTYHPDLAAGCVAAFQAQYPFEPAAACEVINPVGLAAVYGHGVTYFQGIHACRRALEGHSKLGEACTSNFECEASLVCRPEGDEAQTQACLPPWSEGDPCRAQAHCGAGLFCRPDPDLVNRCSSDLAQTFVLRDEGTDCRCEYTADCQSGLICNQDKYCQPAPDRGELRAEGRVCSEGYLQCMGICRAPRPDTLSFCEPFCPAE